MLFFYLFEFLIIDKFYNFIIIDKFYLYLVDRFHNIIIYKYLQLKTNQE